MKKLKKCIERIRESRNEEVTSNELTEEQLFYVNEGYRLGLWSAAMAVADEMDANSSNPSPTYMEDEEAWWREHEEGTETETENE